MKKVLNLPITNLEVLDDLQVGDFVLLSGILYTARDAAHERLVKLVNNNQSLPINLNNNGIYYTGPTPTKPNEIIGSCGPTSAYRMDDYTIPLLKQGLKVMIGKGNRSPKIVMALQEHQAVYLCAIGGAAAKISHCIDECSVVAYEDLGTEAIRKLVVTDMPLIVAIDSHGQNIFDKDRGSYE